MSTVASQTWAWCTRCLAIFSCVHPSRNIQSLAIHRYHVYMPLERLQLTFRLKTWSKWRLLWLNFNVAAHGHLDYTTWAGWKYFVFVLRSFLKMYPWSPFTAISCNSVFCGNSRIVLWTEDLHPPSHRHRGVNVNIFWCLYSYMTVNLISWGCGQIVTSEDVILGFDHHHTTLITILTINQENDQHLKR